MDAPALRSRAVPATSERPAASVNLPDACATDCGERMAALLEAVSAGDLAVLRARIAAVTLDEVAEAVRFSPEGYARVLLARTEDVEVLVLGWLPGQRSPIHDHGLSHGYVKVLAGEGSDDSFALVGDRAVHAERRGFAEGAILEERPDQVHRVVNTSSNVLITLHAYAPCLRGARTHEE
jgi:predicted metal-dependent enzyme (double-stranded beta helix superfamily)